MKGRPTPALAVRAALLALVAAACGEPALPAGPPYTVQVLALTGIDAETEAGTYEVDTRVLTTLTNFDQLEGRHLAVRSGGELVVRALAGSVVSDGEFRASEEPLLRYHVDDGVIVPRDYPTLMMLSAYYQFEQVVAALDRVAGTSIEELSRDWPRLTVFFEPVVRVTGGVEVTVSVKMNAFYLGGKKQFGLATRSDLENVPLAGNLLVTAHEFAHLLFERIFFADAPAVCRQKEREANLNDRLFAGRFELEYAISGLNEGFADFVSFAVTGGTNPMVDLSFLGTERSIRRSGFVYSDRSSCEGEFYCIGTLFARSLYQSMELLALDPANPEDRGQLGREVTAALSVTRAGMWARPELLPAPSRQVASCEQGQGDAVYDGQILGAFFRAFLEGLPATTRRPVCERLVANFGDEGFPAGARQWCP